MDKLRVSIDWIEFTLFDIEFVSAIALFGYDITAFNLSDRGALGYKNSARHVSESVAVFYNGSKGAGVHFRISGSAIAFFLDSFINGSMVSTPFGSALDVEEFGQIAMARLFDTILKYGNFSRLDIAIDDLSDDYLSCDDVVALVENNLCVSKWRDYTNYCKKSIGSDVKKGHTIYFGSRESDIFLRMYDKKLESNVDFTWYRWELELKSIKADYVARQIIDKNDLGSVGVGILSHYIRFIQNDKTRRTNCSDDVRWSAFVGGVEKLKITIPKKQKTIEDKYDWIQRQCMPTLAGLVMYNGGDLSILEKDMTYHYNRNSADNKMLFEGQVNAI